MNATEGVCQMAYKIYFSNFHMEAMWKLLQEFLRPFIVAIMIKMNENRSKSLNMGVKIVFKVYFYKLLC